MANASLDHAATSGQSKDLPFCSLQFKRDEWHLFWRLMAVGCVMSDHLLDAHEYFARVPDHAAKLWNELSNKLARFIKENDVVYHQKKEVDMND